MNRSTIVLPAEEIAPPPPPVRSQASDLHSKSHAHKYDLGKPSSQCCTELVRRLEDIVLATERESGSLCIVSQQSVLHRIYSYFMSAHAHEV